MGDVRVNLAVDNCFASKRWSRPEAWVHAIRKCGLQCVEISADNECDPLYTTPEYISDWADATRRACGKEGLRAVNLFSGHGTYSTTGLAHYDPRVREHLRERWVKPFLSIAHSLEAGVGFFAHAFSLDDLNNEANYKSAVQRLIDDISSLLEWNESMGSSRFAVEQMYTPHQYPWTLATCEEFIRSSGAMIALDVGHASGQHRFLRPSQDEIYAACEGYRNTYLGSSKARMFQEYSKQGKLSPSEAASRIGEDIEHHSYLFAQPEDCNPYAWLEKFGAYSPIVHLQQTDGRNSKHTAFDEKQNGIIEPTKVLSSLQRAFATTSRINKLETIKEITLTLELFYPTSAYPEEILSSITTSAAYWRKWIPKDGMLLSEIKL